MAVPGVEDVYLTLLLTDAYLPGALVLAHSLRDGGTTKKLGVLVTTDSVGAEAITQLKTVYEYIIPVPRIRNPSPANLSLMNRADLHSAFTKINVWKQTNFRKIVYIDADVVAYRAPDELFDLAHSFSAAPDIGWPDLFNTGVMVLTPHMGEYYALMAMAERGISFDGADQGLLNMHFKNNYNRLSFTYNVTPSAHYQYVPAYRHFQSSINMVHFIGSDKPWFQGRYASTGSTTFDEMIGRWWAVYDRHYIVASPTTETSQTSLIFVQSLTKGEFRPRKPQAVHVQHVETTGEPHSGQNRDSGYSQHYENHHKSQPGAAVWQHKHTIFPSVSFDHTIKGTEAEARKEQVPDQSHGAPASQPEPKQKKPEPRPIPMSSWDAQRQPPPADAKPEAANFPSTIYEMSQDATPFVPPERYPSPPRNMWYEVPKERPASPTQKLKSVFPWEANQPAPSRVFAEDSSRTLAIETETSNMPTGEPFLDSTSSGTRPWAESSVTESSAHTNETITPITPTIHTTPSNPWTSFTRTNAWDEVPEIERYVDAMQKHRRTRSSKSPGVIGMPGPGEGVNENEWRRHGSRLTDFPSKDERPSLPVTPAPIRRPKFWGGGGPVTDDDADDDPLLPRAEGVPEQDEWDPVAQLQKLAKQQSEALLQKLGGSGRDSSDLPPRPLPFGSEELISPTYVAQSANVSSPQPVKDSSSSNRVRAIATEEQSKPRTTTAEPKSIAEPSYGGPGAAFEKGEDYSQQQTPLPPTDEERDVLET